MGLLLATPDQLAVRLLDAGQSAPGRWPEGGGPPPARARLRPVLL